MKSFKFFVVLTVMASVISLMQSCSSDNSLSNTTDDNIQSITLYDYELNEMNLQDATFESDMTIQECMPMRPDMRESKGKNAPKTRMSFMLGRVFGQMELTEEQISEIRGLIGSHILCEQQWFRKLHAARIGIINASNLERREIIAKAKNGEITRREADSLIRQLNNRVRNALMNLPINEEAREGLMLCREEFFDSIALILNEEQLVIWDDFLAKMKRQ